MTSAMIDTSGEFLAIAAVGAYNQSYDSSRITQGMKDVGDQIGPMTACTLDELGISETKITEWASASFSAVAYKLNGSVGNLAAGTTVIAFRGIDGVPDWSIWFARRRGVSKALCPAHARE